LIASSSGLDLQPVTATDNRASIPSLLKNPSRISQPSKISFTC
jgi:hypothetical protein